jgi:hypothetical protein
MSRFRTSRAVLNIHEATRRSDRVEVSFPVSCDYNGGIVINDKWYEGIIVPEPEVPNEHELQSIYVGLNHNTIPPTKTMLLVKKGGG